MTLTLLDAAQVHNLTRFLRSPRAADGRWLLVPDLWMWASGRAPFPNLSTFTWPGHEDERWR